MKSISQVSINFDLPEDAIAGEIRVSDEAASLNIAEALHIPSDLCKWSIHLGCNNSQVMSNQSQLVLKMRDAIIQENSCRDALSTSVKDTTLSSVMAQALTNNTFSKTSQKELPLSVMAIVKAVSDSHARLDEDAWGFVIKSRNLGLLDEYLQTPHYPFGLNAIFPSILPPLTSTELVAVVLF